MHQIFVTFLNENNENYDLQSIFSQGILLSANFLIDFPQTTHL